MAIKATTRAAVFDVPVSQDAWAQSADNFGTVDVILPPDAFGPVLRVDLSGPLESRAALEFAVGGIPVFGEQIVSAALVLHFTESDALIGVHAAAGDGGITEADFLFGNLITTFDPESLLSRASLPYFLRHTRTLTTTPRPRPGRGDLCSHEFLAGHVRWSLSTTGTRSFSPFVP